MLVDELQECGHDVQIMGRIGCRDERVSVYVRWCEPESWSRRRIRDKLKTVHPFAAKRMGEPGTDEFPIYYASQAMHGLMVTGRRRSYVPP